MADLLPPLQVARHQEIQLLQPGMAAMIRSPMLIAEVDITAMGYVDGKLHIQVKYEDSLETDNHGYIYFKNDKGEEIHCIANIAFSTDSEHQERYVEYVYDLSDVDLTQYKVYGYFVTSDTHIEGNWSVTFPLESISQ